MADCKNRLRDLLPQYINNALTQNEAKEVELHLKECAKCRGELEELKFLSSGMKDLSETLELPHIESEKLVLYLEEPSCLNLNELSLIEKHLQSCSQCFEELQTLKGVNLELQVLERKEETKYAKEVYIWGKIVERIIWLVRKPAFAYIIVLLLAYPAGRWLFRGSPPIPSLPKIASEKVSILSEQTRETAKPTLVFRSEKENKVRIGIPFWPDLENQSYEIALNTESGQTIYSIKNFTDFGTQGISQLVLNTDSIPDGGYILILKEINKKDTTISAVTYFPFQIVKAK